MSRLGTDEHKPFLEKAPSLLVIFAQNYGLDDAGEKIKHYYVSELVGIATGMLITAVHNAGLATPSPMNFLSKIFSHPSNERAFLILVVGYPVDDITAPVITKKPLDEIAPFI